MISDKEIRIPYSFRWSVEVVVDTGSHIGPTDSDSSLALDYCARYEVSVCMYMYCYCYKGCYGSGLALGPYSFGDGLDWRRHNEDDGEWHFQHNIYWTETRVLNWTVEERRRTDGRAFSSPRPRPVTDRPDEAAPLTLHDGNWLETH